MSAGAGSYSGSRPSGRLEYGVSTSEYVREREEEDEYERVIEQIEDVKSQSVDSSRNALRLLRESEAVAGETMSTLADQRDKLSRVEQRAVVAEYEATRASNRTKDLEKLNRNFLIAKLRIPNPFSSRDRKEKKLMAKALAAEEMRHEQHEIGQDAKRDVHNSQEKFNKIQRSGEPGAYAGLTRANRLEHEIDCEKEDEIDNNLDEISQSLSRLKMMGLAMGEEIQESSAQIKRLDEKSSKIQDKVRRADVKLSRMA